MHKDRAVKTIVYVDGYNLYYGCLKHSADKWLDLKKLFQKILLAQNPGSDLIQIKFFTADIRAKVASHGQAAQIAQQSYHRALETKYPNDICIIKGTYSLERASLLVYAKPPNKENRIDVWKLEEKQTDVRLALEIYRDVANQVIQQVVLVTNDTDLVPALAAVREDFTDQLAIGVIIPRRKGDDGRPANNQLSRYADWTRQYITDLELSASQLPERLPTRKKPIKKPDYW